MSFLEVKQALDPTGRIMQASFIGEGPEFFENMDARLGLAYDLLNEKWQAYTSIPPKLRRRPITSARFVLPYLDKVEYHEITSFWNQTRDVSAVDEVLMSYKRSR